MSEYASRVYLALLDLGLTEARPASVLSKVPTSKIYNVLEQLHAKGLVEITPEYPKRYAPVPFATFLDKLHGMHTEVARDIARRRDALAAQFSVRADAEVSEPGSIMVIRGRRNAFDKVDELLRDASREALFLTSDAFHLHTNGRVDHLRAFAARGCRLRILAPVSDADPAESMESLSRFAEIRERDAFNRFESGRVGVLITDRERALTINFAPDGPHRADGDDTAIYIDQEAIVRTLQSLIEFQWVRAPAYESRCVPVSDDLPSRAPHEPSAGHDAFAPVWEWAKSGATDVIHLDTTPDGSPPGPMSRFMHVAHACRRIRLVVNASRVDVVDSWEDAMLKNSTLSVRHLDSSILARAWVVDDRVAGHLVAADPGIPGTGHGGVTESTHPATVEAFRRHLEREWLRARPLKERRAELGTDEAWTHGATKTVEEVPRG